MTLAEEFLRLQREVGVWGEKNFGDQPAVNPLLGIGEEFGELTEHLEAHDDVVREELDAVGDMLVYAAAFCYRRSLDVEGRALNVSENRHKEPLDGVTVALGRLHRSVLKRRLGIRLDEDGVSDEAEQRAIVSLLCSLSAFAAERGYTLEECIRVAWDEEGSSREWDSTTASVE